MAISVSCECGNRLLLNEEFAGKKVNCPYCNRELAVDASKTQIPINALGGPNRRPASMPHPGPTGPNPGVGGASVASAPPFLRPESQFLRRRPGNSPGLLFTLGLVCVLAIAAAVLHRLEGAVWGLALAAPAVLLSLSAFLYAAKQHQLLSTPLVTLLFAITLAGLTASEPNAVQQWGQVWAKVKSRAFPEQDESQNGKSPIRVSIPGPGSSNDASNVANGTSQAANSAGNENVLVWSPNGPPPRQGDWEFRVVKVMVGKPRVTDIYDTKNAIVEWKDSGLLVSLEVSNKSQSRRYDYKLFKIQLNDNNRNRYEPISIKTFRLVDRQVGNRQIPPGQSINDLLFFEPPHDNIEFLDLVIDGGHADFGELVRIRIPANLIERP